MYLDSAKTWYVLYYQNYASWNVEYEYLTQSYYAEGRFSCLEGIFLCIFSLFKAIYQHSTEFVELSSPFSDPPLL